MACRDSGLECPLVFIFLGAEQVIWLQQAEADMRPEGHGAGGAGRHHSGQEGQAGVDLHRGCLALLFPRHSVPLMAATVWWGILLSLWATGGHPSPHHREEPLPCTPVPALPGHR